MFSRLRRHRWIATLLIAVSPGVLGGAATLLHPCPVDAPWAVAAHAEMQGMEMPAAAAAHAQAHETPAHDAGAHPSCHCIGCCAAPPLTVSPTIAIAVMVTEAPRAPVWRVIEAASHLRPIVDLLPETTAPPLV